MSPVLVGQLAKFNVKPYNLKSLRKVTFGGAAISDEVRQLAQKNLGVFFQCCYGMTEILVMMEPFNGQPGGLPTSVGRCVPGTQAKVVYFIKCQQVIQGKLSQRAIRNNFLYIKFFTLNNLFTKL